MGLEGGKSAQTEGERGFTPVKTGISFGQCSESLRIFMNRNIHSNRNKKLLKYETANRNGCLGPFAAIMEETFIF